MKHGFTIIEMITVIAIIGITAAIVVSSITNQRKIQADRRNGVEKEEKTYQHNGHTFIHDPNCGCKKYGTL
jgi:prepilin-type N-terminal cleavage/methylation domain-containing protein